MKTLMKDLTEGMQRLCAVANRVVAADGKVSALERDLLLDDLRRLYDVAMQIEVLGATATTARDTEAEPVADSEMLSSAMMATMAAMSVPEPEPQPESQPAPQPEPVTEPEPTPTVEPEPKPEPVPEPEPEPAPLPTMEDIESNGNSLLFDEVIIEPEAVAEPINVPEPEPIAIPEPEPIVEPEPIATPKPEPETTAEPEPEPRTEPAKQQASLLDYLKHPQEEHPLQRTLGESLGANSRKVDDLRTVININDKFSFMSELFKNNMRAYNDFILTLNDIKSREEALAVVAETSKQYQWDENSSAVQTFYKIFDKKF